MKQKDKFNEKELNSSNELTFYKYDYNLELIEEAKSSYNVKIEYNKVIKVKSNLILYGNNEKVILKGENSLDDKRGKNMISEIFE